MTGRLIAERPQFYIALTAMILGGQFIVGFIGELIYAPDLQGLITAENS